MKEQKLSPFRFLYFDALPSTNSYLSSLAREGEAEGLVVVARTQSEGKGRFCADSTLQATRGFI